MLNRIPDYPPPQRALDGSEPLAAWQDGKQRAVPILQVALVALAQIMKELDPSATAYGAWLRLPGNAGKSIEDFLRSLIGPAGPGADVLFRRVDYVATAGQTRFPAAGDFPWVYDPRIIACFVNGVLIGKAGYTAPGNLVAPVFAKGLKADDEVVFLSFIAAGQALGLKDLAYTIGKSALDKMNEVRTLDDARSTNATDERDALASLLNDGYRRIRLVGGKGAGANGRYRLGVAPFTGLMPGRDGSGGSLDYIEHRGNLSTGNGLPAHGTFLFGDGIGVTEVEQIDNFMFHHNSMSADPADNLRGFALERMSLIGLGGNTASQTGHIVVASGITRTILRMLELRAFQADGFCAWMGARADTERHNLQLLIDACLFDGVNGRNRNPVSLEDMVGATIRNSTFRRAVTPDDAIAVSGIDLEPRERASYRLSDIEILGNLFEDIGGSAIAAYLNAPDHYLHRAARILIANNRMKRCRRWIDMAGGFTEELKNAQSSHEIEVTGNIAYDVGDLRIQGMRGVRVHHNRADVMRTVKLGDQGFGKGNREVFVDDNVFRRAGTIDGICVLHDDPSTGSLSRNYWSRPGIQDRTDGAGYLFLARYSSEIGMRVCDNIVDDPDGRIKAGFLMGDGCTIGATAEKRGNRRTAGTYTLADNFSPVNPAAGAVYTLTFAEAVSVPASQPYGKRFDVPAAGMKIGGSWRARWSDYLESYLGKDNGSPWMLDLSVQPLHPRALTGVRFAGVRGARWCEIEGVDWSQVPSSVPSSAIWRVPATRMKLKADKKVDATNDHLIPLSAAAVEVLRAARLFFDPSDEGAGINALIFAGRRRGDPIGEKSIENLYKRTRFADRHVPHGWRASFSTILNLDMPGERGAIDRALAHAGGRDEEEQGINRAVEGAYNRGVDLVRRRRLFDRWAEILAGDVTPAAAELRLAA